MYTYTGVYAVAYFCTYIIFVQISDTIHASLSSFLGDAFQGIWPKEKDCGAQDLSKIGCKFFQ